MKQKEYSTNQLKLASKLQYWKSLEASLRWLRGPYTSSLSEHYLTMREPISPRLFLSSLLDICHWCNGLCFVSVGQFAGTI